VSEVVDPGLQPERTALAWRRTCLALLAGSLVAARVLGGLLGVWGGVLGLGGVLAAGVLFVAVERRYARHRRGMAERSPIAGGGLIAALAGLVLAAGVVAVVIVVVLAVRT
jgi:uncharacterized membrane protein YidH (DUF202 family)